MYLDNKADSILADYTNDWIQVRFESYKKKCSSLSNSSICAIHAAVNEDANIKVLNKLPIGTRHTSVEYYSYNFVNEIIQKYIQLYKSSKINYYGESSVKNDTITTKIMSELKNSFSSKELTRGRVEAVLYQMQLGHKYGAVNKEIYRPVKTVTPKESTQKENATVTKTENTTEQSSSNDVPNIDIQTNENSSNKSSITKYIVYGVGAAVAVGGFLYFKK